MNVINLLICLALLFSTFTQLRFSTFGVGLGEICGLISILYYLSTKGFKKIDCSLVMIACVFFFGILIGIINNNILNNISKTSIRDFFALLYSSSFAILLATIIKYNVKSFNYFLIVMDIAIICHAGILFLPFIGVEFPYWLGNLQGETLYAPFPFEGRYVGLAQNPHQIGVLLAIFTGFIFVKRGNSFYYNLFHMIVLCSALTLFILIKSTTLIFVYCLLGFIYLSNVINKLHLFFKLVAYSFLSTLVLYFYVDIFNYVIEMLAREGKSDANGRFDLWLNALSAINTSNMLGLGPGAHSGAFSAFDEQEAHNVLLDILMQGGIISLASYFTLLYFAIKKSLEWNNSLWIPVIISLTSVQMSGFLLRHIYSWIPYFILIVWTSEHGNSLKLYFHKNIN